MVYTKELQIAMSLARWWMNIEPEVRYLIAMQLWKDKGNISDNRIRFAFDVFGNKLK